MLVRAKTRQLGRGEGLVKDQFNGRLNQRLRPEGVNQADRAEELDISSRTLQRWDQEYKEADPCETGHHSW